MDKNISKFIFATFKELFETITPALNNYQLFSKSLTKQIKLKKNDNIQYDFDLKLDKIVRKNLKSFGLTGKIFSEEGGFFEVGSKKYRIVYDPFCNSTLASLTFRDAAVGISIFDYNYNFITSALMDYQTGIVAIVEDGKTSFYQVQNKAKLDLRKSKVNKIEDSFTILTLEKKPDRKNFKRAEKIISKANKLSVGSGHIYWLRLAMGKIDAYLDPIGGEILYEMFAASVAQACGCVVTDLKGVPFDPSKYLKIFEKNTNHFYYPVAASTQKLHSQLLKNLKHSGK